MFKTIKQNFLQVALLLVFLASAARAGDSGTNGMVFLTIDTDAGLAAMAGASSAIAKGPQAAFYNPAGLAADSATGLQLSHHAGLAGITQEFASYAFTTGSHHLAFSVNIFNNPDIEIRQGPTDQPDGLEDALSFYGGFSYARIFAGNWFAGATVKYLYQKLYLNSANGWAVDLGIQRRNLIAGLDWGFTLQNAGKMEVLKEQATRLPLLIRSGLVWRTDSDWTAGKIAFSADGEYIRDDVTTLRLGTEIPVLQALTLRGGYRLGSFFNQWSAGIGIILNRFRFDYAYIPDTYELGTGHHFSLQVAF